MKAVSPSLFLKTPRTVRPFIATVPAGFCWLIELLSAPLNEKSPSLYFLSLIEETPATTGFKVVFTVNISSPENE